VDTPSKSQALEELARTPPASARDLEALYQLFERFPDKPVREAALRSLRLLDAGRRDLEPAVVYYLRQPEPESFLFGAKAALRLRCPRALPLIEAMARRRFSLRKPEDATLISERNQWWAQYEALYALGEWTGPQARALVVAKTEQAPGVARILSALY